MPMPPGMTTPGGSPNLLAPPDASMGRPQSVQFAPGPGQRSMSTLSPSMSNWMHLPMVIMHHHSLLPSAATLDWLRDTGLYQQRPNQNLARIAGLRRSRRRRRDHFQPLTIGIPAT